MKNRKISFFSHKIYTIILYNIHVIVLHNENVKNTIR